MKPHTGFLPLFSTHQAAPLLKIILSGSLVVIPLFIPQFLSTSCLPGMLLHGKNTKGKQYIVSALEQLTIQQGGSQHTQPHNEPSGDRPVTDGRHRRSAAGV